MASWQVCERGVCLVVYKLAAVLIFFPVCENALLTFSLFPFEFSLETNEIETYNI